MIFIMSKTLSFWLSLPFEVKLKLKNATKTQINLNKQYENNLQKVVIFITTPAF